MEADEQGVPKSKGGSMSRREFAKAAATAATAFTIVPSHVLGGPGKTPPSEKLTLAGIGVGGVGSGQLRSCDQAGFQIVALCDVDDDYARKSFDRWPDARRYRDFREMLEAEGDKIDAVHVATPDHTHAAATLAVLEKGKHVCCVKPLTRTIQEERLVAEAARKAGVATQVTASPNNTETGRRTCEIIWDGAIGNIYEAHVWTNRPLWPQGMARPEGADPVPKNLDWDLWLGPAPERPFKDKWPVGDPALEEIQVKKTKARDLRGIYHPWCFRGWVDFGTGALGDMGCHRFNVPKLALKLDHPTSVSATATKVFPETWPLASIVTWEFPAREGMPPLKMVWYDGGLKPPRPKELEADRELPNEGVLYYGDKGVMLEYRILPESKMKQYTPPPKTLPRGEGTFPDWMAACRGGKPAACEFGWAAPLTELVLLGDIAIRVGGLLKWDGPAMQFTNSDAANRLVKAKYRKGWGLPVSPKA